MNAIKISHALNAEQSRAATYGLESADCASPPMLIIAGAGSGKTKTIAHRVAELVSRNVDPNRILLLTFSRQAAREMARQAGAVLAGQRLLADDTELLPWCGTFHAIGARILREHAGEIGLDPNFTIHDREDSADLMNLVRTDLGFADPDYRFPTKATCLSIYSRCVNADASHAEILRAHYSWALKWAPDLQRLFAAYVQAKQDQNILDLDDLILYWARAVKDPNIAAEMGDRFDHILVDEFQDTNRLQASILLNLKPDGRGLAIVGDDAQSIYAFRAAEVRNILDFPQKFDPPAEIVTLDQNYRSSQSILAAANGVISFAAERFTNNLRTERFAGEKPKLVSASDEIEAARYVVRAVLERRECGVPFRDQAVLFRAAFHSAALETELFRARIPFQKFGGLKFLDAAHVKDLLAVLRFAENPADRISGLRTLLLIPGIGASTAREILDGGLTPENPKLAQNASWGAFTQARAKLRSADWPAKITLARGWLEPLLEGRYDNFAQRQADLTQLEQIAGAYTSLRQFLTELALDPIETTSGQVGRGRQDEDALVLSTIHSAKGREWNSVFVLNVAEGALPCERSGASPESIEEERRLLYVAMTRARDELHLLVPMRHGARRQNAWSRGENVGQALTNRSRFLPNELLPLFDEVAWPPAGDCQASERPPLPRRINAAADLRGMWA